MEEFRDLLGYEGLYQVSNLGRVKSLKYGKERILTPGTNNSGYYLVVLYKNKKAKTYKIHQLVAICFLNHNPNGLTMVVDHINFNRKDNNLSNLRIISMRENGNQKQFKSTSCYVGVSWDSSRGKWHSHITIEGKIKFLGRFTDELEAHNAYQTALKTI